MDRTTSRFATDGGARALVAAIAIVPVLAGCAPVAGPVDVEAVVVGDDGRERLGTTTIESVRDLFRGEGALFDVRAGAGFEMLDAVSSGVLESTDASALDVAESSAVHPGYDVRPRLSFDPLGERFVADDFDSLLYLTAFANFERAWVYFRDVIGDRSLATSRKTFVALYSDVYLSDAVPLPLPIIPKNDNAAFHPFFDYFLLMRVHDQDGVPLGMHAGVTAHEFQHRVFHWNVTADERVFGAWKAATSSVAFQLARGVDEGLADAFALGFVGGEPHFLESALGDRPLSVAAALGAGFEAQGALRDVDGDFARGATWEQIVSGFDDGVAALLCGSLDALQGGGGIESGQVLAFNPYCLGTLVARTIYEAADEDGAVLVDDVLPRVHASFPVLVDRMARHIDETGAYGFEVSWALDAIAATQSDARRARLCGVLAQRFAPLVDAGEVPSCP